MSHYDRDGSENRMLSTGAESTPSQREWYCTALSTSARQTKRPRTRNYNNGATDLRQRRWHILRRRWRPAAAAV